MAGFNRQVDGREFHVVQVERDGVRRENSDKINTISLRVRWMCNLFLLKKSSHIVYEHPEKLS